MPRETHPQSRAAVLEAFRVAPTRRFPLSMIVDQVDKTSAERFPVESIRAAVGWQADKGNLKHFRNDEMERDEWRLTDAGRDELGV